MINYHFIHYQVYYLTHLNLLHYNNSSFFQVSFSNHHLYFFDYLVFLQYFQNLATLCKIDILYQLFVVISFAIQATIFMLNQIIFVIVSDISFSFFLHDAYLV